ncbi:hypothetical protein AYO20_00685 [Fonsecaea nubica]|uniref:Xylanolytic transcriptional activator regulatory domain-containing protein n=1 Tax=Fonsecaea nubica TaxID=856822 RepID=A0A178DGT7_9EURO|nr:hypothetical protein AYO20_00685 [Fonsecaea nubica]OAL40265.1 hypothetical protein AYO20_00685 [Fonsecaea nubica]
MAEGLANTQPPPGTVIVEEPGNGARGRRNNSIACLNCRRRKVKQLPPDSVAVMYQSALTATSMMSSAPMFKIDAARRIPVQGPSRQRLNGTQSRTVKGFTKGSTPPPHQNFSHFNVDLDFGDLAEEASGDARVSDDILLAMASTSTQDWPGWIEGGETSDPFHDLAGVVPGDGLPAELCPFNIELPFSHPEHDSFPESEHGEYPGERQDTLSPPMNPPAAGTVGAPSKDDRARKWSVVTSAPSPDDDASDVTEQLTNRLGRLQIAEDGHPRYFGSTSNLYILHHGPKSLHKPNIRDVMTLGDAAADKAGYHWTPAAEYEAELITLFFSWYNALVNVVDQDIFFRERALFKSGKRSDLYSPALENAVYAIGAMVTTTPHPDIPGSADEFFGFRTKACLDIEIDSPTLATAQALLILSALEAAHSRDSRGWIYVGMAVQIVSDLGLHLDLQQQYAALCGSGGSSSRTGNPDDVNILRINLFWACKTLDTLWGALSGRPTLMGNIINNVPSPIPSRTYTWTYYTNKFSTMTFPPDFDFGVAAHVPVHLASLAMIMGKISETLYCGVPNNISNLTSFVEDRESELRRWFCSLPPALTIDKTTSLSAVYLPCVLELHLQYYDATILLHRPQISASDRSSPTRTSSLDKCINGARDICRILVHYRRRYGLQRIHCSMVHVTMTASLIHVFHLYLSDTAGVDNAEAQGYFSTCIQALGEMGQTYKSALRALDVLLSLRQNWQYAASTNPTAKKLRSG